MRRWLCRMLGPGSGRVCPAESRWALLRALAAHIAQPQPVDATDKDCAEAIVRAHRALVERAEWAEGELRKLLSAYLGAEPPAAMRPDAETILRVLSMRGGVQG